MVIDGINILYVRHSTITINLDILRLKPICQTDGLYDDAFLIHVHVYVYTCICNNKL